MGSLLLGGCQRTVSPTPAGASVPLSVDVNVPVDPPEPPAVVVWDFHTGKTLGWKPTHDLQAFESDEQGLHTAPTGGDPYMVGPDTRIDAAQAYYVMVRMRSTLGGDAQLFWITAEDPRYDERKSQHFTPKADGRWHTYTIPVHENASWIGTIEQLRLDPAVREGGEISIAWIKVVGMQPGYMEIASFGTTTAVVEAHRPFTVEARIINAGDTALSPVALRLELPPALSLVTGETQVTPEGLAGGDEHLVSWTVQAPAGVYELALMRDDAVVEQGHAVVAGPDDSVRTLDSGGLRLAFPRQPYGYGVATFSSDRGPLGHLRSLGSLVYRTAGGRQRQALLFAEQIEHVEGGMRLPFAFRDADGIEWRGETLVRPAADGTGYDVEATLQVDQDVQLLNWTPLAFYAGDGTFGTAKESALFPGVEFLLDDEKSSGTDFFDPPNHRRYVPDPLKVTVPLMAITQDGTSVGLTWDPLRAWDGTHDRPGAFFSAPNTWDGQENQVMALFAPGPALDGEENRVVAATPYALSAGQSLSLTARLFAVPAEDALAPMVYWLQSQGLPPLPPLPRPYEAGVRVSLDATLGPTWDEEQQGWHYALHDPWGPGASPANALHLWLAALRNDLTSEEQEQVRTLVRAMGRRADYAGGQPNPELYIPALAMHLADSDDLLHLARLGRSRLAGQNPAGFWPYVPQARSGRAFGEIGDTSSGQVAAHALYLLTFARITGDVQLADAGLEALAYLESHQSRRPEGAQTWELPLHCPDLLAAAWAQQSYLEAYRLTGDPHYAERAQWWAVSGLPFIYLWSAPDRPVMAYTTIPVFAATNYTYSWLGRPVMWNGLDYALGLWDLSAALEEAGVVPLTDWRQVAEGITRAGMQMQPEAGPFLGMFPDAWSVVTGGEAYTWWLHPFYILQNLYLMQGAEARVETIILRDENPTLHISAVADILRAERRNGRLEIDLRYYAGETTVLMLGQVPGSPARVQVDGQAVPEIEALADHAMGWRYLDHTLLVKIPFTGEKAVVVIE